MHQHLEPATFPPSSPMEDNRILAEVETIVGGTESRYCQDEGDVPLDAAAGRRRVPWLLLSILVVAAALVPAGLKSGELLAKVAHEVAGR